MLQRAPSVSDQSPQAQEASSETEPGTSALRESAPTQLRAGPEGQDPRLGTVVGSFRLVRKLGGGGMGSVYLGEHTVIGSKVAVKFLHAHLASNETLVQRFLAEARAVNLIGHENIISVYDMNVLPPRQHYLIMEYLEGRPLSSLMGRPISASVIVPILTQVCDALQAAHSRGVIHRDLKPENIFLIRRERTPHFVKVLDFGIAKLLDPRVSRPQTVQGMLLGTPEYMAPEQWTAKPVDGRTDQYALGLIAYTLLTGQRPFSGEGLGELLQAHLKQVPLSPHGVRPEVPAVLSDVIMRMLAKRPEDRFQSASELRAALDRAMAPTAAVGVSTATIRTAPLPATVVRETPMAPPRVLATPMAAPVARATPMAPAASPVPRRVGPSSPSAANRLAELIVWASFPPGSESRRMSCTDLTHAGAFLCTDGALPPLRARVSLTLELQDRLLPCMAEVVRHVLPEQAASWGMRAGYAVQFVDLSHEAREALARVSHGQPPVPPRAAKTFPDDPQAEALLGALLRHMSSDPYTLLSLSQDATFDDIRHNVRTVQRHLESIAARPLSARQVRELAEVRARVEKAAELLGNPRQRIEHDARQGNYPGVARSIASGLSATELESLRVRYLQARPGTEMRARLHATSATLRQAQGQLELSLTEYEKALSIDPLNLPLHQHYWNLKRRDSRPGVAPPASSRPRSLSGSFPAASEPSSVA